MFHSVKFRDTKTVENGRRPVFTQNQDAVSGCGRRGVCGLWRANCSRNAPRTRHSAHGYRDRACAAERPENVCRRGRAEVSYHGGGAATGDRWADGILHVAVYRFDRSNEANKEADKGVSKINFRNCFLLPVDVLAGMPAS